MSQSPLSADQQRTSYEAGWGQILHFINSGGSWSGHERNACFLNTRGGRFADISAVAGLDFMDDGRCVGAVDWDHDGDLDLWLASRTGPRLRFVRNDLIHEDEAGDSNYLSLRLRGDTCNRDAIGARVTIAAGGEQFVRTLHAGSGYLTQASKWVHVGLGSINDIESVVVRWPGGQEETFEGIAVNQRWKLTQGEGQAEPSSVGQRNVDLTPQRIATLPDQTASRVVVLDRMPVPSLTYEDLDGKQQTTPTTNGGPMLINLWATWCQPCAAELREMSEAEQAIRDANLSILALSVDGLGDDNSTLADAKKMMNTLKFPFDTGAANVPLLEVFDAFQEVFISLRPQKDAIPTSFLLDEHGRLAVIYVGPVTVEKLLADVKMIGEPQPLANHPAFPFAGRWFAQPRRTGDVLVDFTFEFEKRSMRKEAMQFAFLAADLATRDAMPADKLTKLANTFYDAGNDCLTGGELVDAKRYYEACLRLNPRRAEALSNLGSVYHQMGQTSEAKRRLTAALNINRRLVPPNMNLGIILLEEGENAEAAAFFEIVLQLAPTQADAHNFLGLALARQGRVNRAATHFESAIHYGNTSAQANLQKVLRGEKP